MVSNQRQILNELYVEHGLIQTVVDVPVEDAFRGGVDIQTKQLDPQQVKAVISRMEQENDYAVIKQEQKWNRLFGGAGIVVITGQNPKSPLNVDRIKENDPLYFRDADMWELFWDKQNVEGYNIELQQYDFEYYDYYGEKLHKSRVMVSRGIIAPSFVRPRLRGWGMSIIEPIIRSFNQYLKSTDLIFEVLDEFKVDAYKIKNLANTLLLPGGEAKVQQRIALANQQKSFQKAIVMDSEDDFIQKLLSFAGIADIMREIRMQVACDLRMPITKIFGVSSSSAGGLGNSSQDDLENYNAMVESNVRERSKYHLLKMIQLRCQQMFGMIPDDLDIEFKPLRILSAKEEEEVKTSKFARVLASKQGGFITDKEYRDSCNQDNLLPIQLEVTDEALAEIEGQQEEMAAEAEPKDSKSESKEKKE